MSCSWKIFFGYKANSNQEADFAEAGVRKYYVIFTKITGN